MKKLDLRSVIIGILMTVIFFLLTGQSESDVRQIGIFKKLYVDTLSVSDLTTKNGYFKNLYGNRLYVAGTITIVSQDHEKGKTLLSIQDMSGGSIIALGQNKFGGQFEIYHNNGVPQVVISANETGSKFELMNKNDVKIVTLKADKNKDGMIGLFDRYGDLGWGMSGKK